MIGLIESEEFWLNVTNIGLGLCTAGGLLAVGWATLRDIIERARKHTTVIP